MTGWRIYCLALGTYVLGLVATAPATLVDAGLQRASHGRAGITEAQGTLWSGAGQLEWHDADRRTGVSQETTWRFLPWKLLSGLCAWEIGLGDSPGRFPVTISLSNIEVADARIALPAATLGLAVPRLVPLELHGDMLIHVAHASIAPGMRLKGEATLQWRNASSTLATVAPLGDYELRLVGEGTSVHAVLRTLRGPLQLEGEGSWPLDSPLAFAATARVPGQFRQQLAPLLRLIAVEHGDGRFALRLE